MLTKAALVSIIAQAVAAPLELKIRQDGSCPPVHVFGARETTAPAGYGSSESVVEAIVAANSGATSEAIDYPAVGDSQYSASVQAGVQAVAEAVNNYVQQCPDTKIVLVGYSQGSQIIDDAMCGGGDSYEGITDTTAPIDSDTASHVAAMIWMGNPRHAPGASYNVGSSTAGGVSLTLSFHFAVR
jgi:acetylxylan esterase